MSGLFLSDLHLFSRRSIGQQHWDRQRDAVVNAEAIVLGGDIFDFRWSQLGNFDVTLQAAASWLDDAIALNPSASWVYLLGNHDCHPRMQALLTSLHERHPTFNWSPTFWRIGSNVFLHGDVLDGIRVAGGLGRYRERFHDDRAKGELSNLLYSAVLHTRLHGVVPRVRHTKPQTCKTLLEYLEGLDSALTPDVRSVYFGHTHVPMEGYRYDRFEFHNAGSGIRYLTFKPIYFDVP